MHDGLTNRYSLEMDGKLLTLVPLTPNQIYDEQLKLKTRKMVENKSLYIRETYFTNKVLSCFDDDVIS
jgi:hypothetical protein